MKYRPEIDGLRAVAVIAVILFHGFGSPRGGFLGVDVFFVISGFLITQILHASLTENRFSLSAFYNRRIRRIVPALLVMMLVSVPVAYMLMLPDDLENFGQSLVATVFFSNNVLLYKTSGYFALSSEFKPLIHTWTLGVEEQFYLAVPLLMAFAYRLARTRGVVAGVALLTLASLAASLRLSTTDPNANFYLIFSRAWELGAGALTAFAAARVTAPHEARYAAAASWLGLAAVLTAMFLFDTAMRLPAWPTLLPVAGTCALLLFAHASAGAGKVLSMKPIVFVGLISYSLYLYHQPVLAFARVASLEEPGAAETAMLLPITFVLALLSWHFVEKPFRSRTRLSNRQVLSVSGGLAALLVAIGAILHVSAGFYQRWPELHAAEPSAAPLRTADYNLRPMRYKGVRFDASDERRKVLVLGNSFARDFVNILMERFPDSTLAISYSEMPDSMIALPEDMAHNARMADLVVLGSGVSNVNLRSMRRRVRELAEVTSTRVVVLGTKNFGWNNNAVMRLPARERYAFRVHALPEAMADNALGRRAFPDIYIDIIALLSDAQGRVPVFTPDHKFISEDRLHYTAAGARYVGSLILAQPPFQVLR